MAINAEATPGDLIVRSRLLVVQSKRLLLASAERSLVACASDARQARVTQLHQDITIANQNYRRAVLDWASTDSSQFWQIVYKSLIEGVGQLGDRMRSASGRLPDTERTDMLADAASLDVVLQRWRQSMLSTLTEDAA
jgi:hypothetical protein